MVLVTCISYIIYAICFKMYTVFLPYGTLLEFHILPSGFFPSSFRFTGLF